jgi:MFS family permease
MDVSAEEMQIASSIFFLPWAFRVFYGIISDSFPIFG